MLVPYSKKLHDCTSHKTTLRSKRIDKYDVFIIGSRLIRKACSKLAGNKDIPVKQFLLTAGQMQTAARRSNSCDRPTDPSRCGVPHNGDPAIPFAKHWPFSAAGDRSAVPIVRSSYWDVEKNPKFWSHSRIYGFCMIISLNNISQLVYMETQWVTKGHLNFI
jgi:hypothetical protein